MAELKYEPAAHDREAFLNRARGRRGFQEAFDALETEYQVTNGLIAARARAGLTQEALAQRMGSTKSARHWRPCSPSSRRASSRRRFA